MGTLAPASFGQAASPLTLHDAIQQAQSGPLARESQDQVDAARGFVSGAALRPNPRLYLSSEDLQPWNDNFSFSRNTEDYAYLGQLFELGGKRSSRLRLAHATVTQTESQRAVRLQEIAGRVAVAYWSAAVSQRVVALLGEDMKAVDQMIAYTKERVDSGAGRGVDLLRVQIERDRLQLALDAAQRDATSSRIELLRLMGRQPTEKVQLTSDLSAVAPVPSSAIDKILAARPDIAAVRSAVAEAEANLRLQHSLAFPDLDLLAGYKRNSGADTLYSSIQLPLPFRNRNQGEVERAKANLRLEQDRLTQLELTVRSDVEAAEQAYRQQQEIVRDVLPDMRARARKNLNIMDDAYRTGGVDLLRYLDAERTEFDVEVTALRTLAEFQQAAVRLQLAYGVQP